MNVVESMNYSGHQKVLILVIIHMSQVKTVSLEEGTSRMLTVETVGASRRSEAYIMFMIRS